jgi:ATP/ADP translocase
MTSNSRPVNDRAKASAIKETTTKKERFWNKVTLVSVLVTVAFGVATYLVYRANYLSHALPPLIFFMDTGAAILVFSMFMSFARSKPIGSEESRRRQ